MENFDNNEFARLTQRVEILEQKIQYLGRVLSQIGENVADSRLDVPKNEKVNNEAMITAATKGIVTAAAQYKEAAPVMEYQTGKERNFSSITGETKKEDDMASPDDNSLADGLDRFKQKYESGSVDFDLNLDIARDLIKDLKRYPDWNQVPDSLTAMLYLEEAYDSNIFYADCVQIQDEFYYFVAPAEPDTRYTQRDLIRMALPFFFNISYSPDLGGRLIKLVQPAVFMLDSKGGYVLKTKGKLMVER